MAISKLWHELEPGEEGVSAQIVIAGAGAMDDSGRSEVAQWLREQADKLVARGRQYAEIYEAERRYIRGVGGEVPTN